MKRLAHGFLAGFILLFFCSTGRAAQEVQASLVLSHSVARPGDTVTAAIRLNHAPGWHTYWRNPGDSGYATSVEWEVPAGVKPGDIQWPVPEKMVLLMFLSYVYEGETFLLIPIQLDADLPPGPVTLKGSANWLQCSDEICVPADAALEGTLLIGSDPTLSPEAVQIDTWRKRLPQTDPSLAVTARWAKAPVEDERALIIEWSPRQSPAEPDFFPYESGEYTVQPQTEVLQADSVVATIQKTVSSGEGWPTEITGLLLDRSEGEHPAAYEVTLQIPADSLASTTATTAAGATSETGGGAAPFAGVSLWQVILFAFLGGLILNIMPCVLPVIALKVLSFVNQGSGDHSRGRQLGLIYAGGVIASFLVIAGLIIGVQKAGGIASWGMQFQNPVFLVVMITLVTLIALNLFGVFEITLGGKTMGTASQIASREGRSGAFFHGVLATVLGTSCTAPFLAFAIGYALSQSPTVIVLLFAVMGLGLAFPYVVLTWNPRLLRLLPKPGAWMERFKVAMGFPMLATAVWLFGVAVKAHFGGNGAFWLALFLVLVGFGAWVWGEFVQRGSTRRPLAAAISFAALVFAVAFVLEGRLQWRAPVYAGDSETILANDADGIQWAKWSPEAVTAARAEGRPVLVDFTADWCLNCQANKITSIEIEPVEKKLKEMNAVALIGDFTRKNPEIASELRRFERAGVPLVLVYPANPEEPPIVLPPALTPQVVLNALEQAASAGAASSVGQTASRSHAAVRSE